MKNLDLISHSTNMKILRCSSNSISFVSKLIKGFANPVRTLATKSNAKAETDTLYTRLVSIKDRKASMAPILNNWVNEKGEIHEQDVEKIIKQFRKYSRYDFALQISEWLISNKKLGESPKHLAVQLDLVSKVHGINQAEKYFNEIPESYRDSHVYGSLLNCYVHAKLTEKAENIMQKLKDMGADTSLAYNVMLKLYSSTKDYSKFDSLVEGMPDGKGNIMTTLTRLNTYAVTSNIPKMENLFKEMEADGKIDITWNAYVNAANGYLKVGFKEKALEMLKKAEAAVKPYSRKFAYELLMTTYAAMGNKDDVYRIWDLSKNMRKMYNTSYLCVISSLDKSDDLDGAEKIFTEWEEKRRDFDIRIPNLLITAYTKRGFLEKGEMVIEKLEESENKPNASTWSRMALGYMLKDRKEEMVEAYKKCIMAGQSEWKPNFDIMSSCIDYLKEKGDGEKLEEIKRLVEENGHNYAEMCEKIAKRHENKMKKSEEKEDEDDDDLIKNEDEEDGKMLESSY